MIREVKIDGQLVDVNDNNVEGYIFTSPIFRDLDYINQNRTSTFRVPITDHNRKVFGLSDIPEVKSVFPYKEHSFEEWRDGMLFFKGLCTLLSTNDDNFELKVVWGNVINFDKLFNLKLRELSSDDSLRWDSNTQFMDYNSTDNFGFPLVDLGKGVSDMQYIHPSVNLQYIIKLIEDNTGVEFEFPKRFDNVFPKTWIPLTDKNANRLTWAEYTAYCSISNIYTFQTPTNYSLLKLNALQSGHQIVDVGTNYSYIKGKAGSTVRIQLGAFLNVGNISSNPGQYKLMIYASGGGQTFGKQFFDIVKNDSGVWVSNVSVNMTFDLSQDIDITLRCSYTTNESPYLSLTDSSVTSVFAAPISVRYEEVRFGDLFPIVPNLPDLSCVGFLSSIMQMYGLFTQYRKTDDNVYFLSIDDIYRDKPNAYNWTHRLETIPGRMRFKIEYNYKDYAQKNNVFYAEDDTVKTNADGVIVIDNLTLENTDKTLFTIPYAPSDNITIGDNNNTYAKILLYKDEDGLVEYNGVTYRILTEKEYIGEAGSSKKSLYFDESQKFNGEKGLLNEHYKAYQHILQHPVVATCYVAIKEIDLYTYDESKPVFIDGVYYAPIEVRVSANGLATCKIIKMPYLDIE